MSLLKNGGPIGTDRQLLLKVIERQQRLADILGRTGESLIKRKLILCRQGLLNQRLQNVNGVKRPVILEQ